MKLHNLIRVGTNRPVRRRGRGQGSGLGGTAGRGHKGGKARSGYSPAPCCCGIPYYRRLPMRGFNNSIAPIRFVGINLNRLEELAADHATIDRDVLVETGIIKASEGLVKILGNGKLTKVIKVIADKFSVTAKQKIEAIGGSIVELISNE
ncbi:MAG: 50S ribosomal protein L15 [Puniceicoccales bacterium]|jgi:large subunit ribosomal protein L15|nr:50S ribosomal protein L15 [Puniceicoccales bacterium]